MARKKVVFYKVANNSKGEDYNPRLFSYEVKGRVSDEDAIQAAIQSFEAEWRIADWRKMADFHQFE